METLGLEEDQAIEHKILSNAIENAQKKVEGRNFDIRKNVLQYDDVMNQQREIIYAQRRKVLDGENLSENFASMLRSCIAEHTALHCHKEAPKDTWNVKAIYEDLVGILGPEDTKPIEDRISEYTP